TIFSRDWSSDVCSSDLLNIWRLLPRYRHTTFSADWSTLARKRWLPLKRDWQEKSRRERRFSEKHGREFFGCWRLLQGSSRMRRTPVLVLCGATQRHVLWLLPQMLSANWQPCWGFLQRRCGN